MALFEKLLKRHDKKPDDPKTLEDLIRSALTKWDNKETCVTASLDSLVDMGILERQKKLIGYKFPTINPGKFLVFSHTALCCVVYLLICVLYGIVHQCLVMSYVI